MSRFPSRDLRAQNRCVLKRSARLDRRRVDDRKSSTPERARKLRFLSNGLFSLLVERSLPFTLQKSTPHMGSKTRGSQSASSIPSVTKRGKKRDTNNRERYRDANVFSHRLADRKRVLPDRVVRPDFNRQQVVVLVVVVVLGQQRIVIGRRRRSNISASSHRSRHLFFFFFFSRVSPPFVFARKACLALSTLLYKGVASSSSSSSFFFVSSTTFKSRTTKVFSRRLKRTQL